MLSRRLADELCRSAQDLLAFVRPAIELLAGDAGGEVATGVSPGLLPPDSMGASILLDGAGGDTGDLQVTASLSDDDACGDMQEEIRVDVHDGNAGGGMRTEIKFEGHGGDSLFQAYDEEAATAVSRAAVLRGCVRIDMCDKEEMGLKSSWKLQAVHDILEICVLVVKLIGMIGLMLAGYYFYTSKMGSASNKFKLLEKSI